VTHSYFGKPCPITSIVEPGYPDVVFTINLADGTGVGVGVGPGVGVGVGPGVGANGRVRARIVSIIGVCLG
jgi:hypothetical protein